MSHFAIPKTADGVVAILGMNCWARDQEPNRKDGDSEILSWIEGGIIAMRLDEENDYSAIATFRSGIGYEWNVDVEELRVKLPPEVAASTEAN